MSISSDWANLPEDILNTVFDKLFPYKEYTLCGLLCKSWLSAAAANLQRQQKRLGIDARFPVLMLPTYSDKIRTRTCFSITSTDNNSQMVLNTQLPPHLHYHEIRGSSHGWLILVSGSDNKTSLFNPVRNQEIRIPPPPSRDKYMLGKMIVSARRSCSPIRESNFVVVATLEPWKSLCFIRSGDKNWTRVTDKKGKYWTNNTCTGGISNIEDIIFHNQRLLVLDSQNRVFALDFLSDSSPQIRIRTIVPLRATHLPGHVHYIAKSSTGELLLILGYIVGSSIEELLPNLRDPSTMPFKVYKLGRRRPTGELDWIEMKGIGDDQVAFLGSHQSSCVKVPPGHKANCIYIAYDYWLVSGFFREVYNLGVYSFEDGSFRGEFNKGPTKVLPYSITPTRRLATCFPVWLSLEMPKF